MKPAITEADMTSMTTRQTPQRTD